MTRLPAALAALAAAALAQPAVAQRAAPPAIATDPAIAALRDRALADETAWDIVEALTTEIGPRMTNASPAQARARDWSLARLRAMGFRNVRVEPYTIADAWERGTETAEIVAPFAQPLRLTALGNSGATPAAGLTLPIAYFASLADLMLAPDAAVRGRIVFVSNAMPATQDGSGYGGFGGARFTGPNIAARKGAAAIVIRSIGTDSGRGPHAGNTNFDAGVTPIPAAALAVADAANLERMIARGRPVTMRLVLTPRFAGPRQSGNVVAEVLGSDPKAGIVTIGGHLDSWDLGTGAIDDASGIAITAAAARLVAARGRPRRTIRVVWFGDEESGGHGGIAYAKAHAGERHAFAAESDFGADRVWRVRATLPGAAAALGDRVAAALAPLGIARSTSAAGGGTDVEPTIALGAATIALDQSGLRYFDYHHTPEDTLERVDRAELRQNVAAWATMLALVANAPEAIGMEAPATPSSRP